MWNEFLTKTIKNYAPSIIFILLSVGFLLAFLQVPLWMYVKYLEENRNAVVFLGIHRDFVIFLPKALNTISTALIASGLFFLYFKDESIYGDNERCSISSNNV